MLSWCSAQIEYHKNQKISITVPYILVQGFVCIRVGELPVRHAVTTLNYLILALCRDTDKNAQIKRLHE